MYKSLQLLLIIIFLAAADSTSIRETCIDFVIAHEGGYSTLKGIEYNHGLSGKYHGDVKLLTVERAKQKYRKLWAESKAGEMLDSIYALFYFDTYVLFNPTAAKRLIVAVCGYDSFLMDRFQLHLDQIKKRPYLQDFLYGYGLRISHLRDMAIYWKY